VKKKSRKKKKKRKRKRKRKAAPRSLSLSFFVTLPDNISNQLMEFFRRVYPLKQLFYKYFDKEK
jgi:hypothetical protein